MTLKTCLVTGGAGFIGSHFCDRLISEGFRVICLDNLVTGKTENINHLIDNNNCSYIEFDVTNHIEIEEDIDYVVHMASIASPKVYLRFMVIPKLIRNRRITGVM